MTDHPFRDYVESERILLEPIAERLRSALSGKRIIGVNARRGGLWLEVFNSETDRIGLLSVESETNTIEREYLFEDIYRNNLNQIVAITPSFDNRSILVRISHAGSDHQTLLLYHADDLLTEICRYEHLLYSDHVWSNNSDAFFYSCYLPDLDPESDEKIEGVQRSERELVIRSDSERVTGSALYRVELDDPTHSVLIAVPELREHDVVSFVPSDHSSGPILCYLNDGVAIETRVLAIRDGLQIFRFPIDDANTIPLGIDSNGSIWLCSSSDDRSVIMKWNGGEREEAIVEEVFELDPRGTLQDMAIFADRIFVAAGSGNQYRLDAFDLDGRLLGTHPFPTGVAALWIAPMNEPGRILVKSCGFAVTSELFIWDSEGDVQPYHSPIPLPFQEHFPVSVDRLTVRSNDGTDVPVTLLTPEASAESTLPVLVWVYGGYGMTLPPAPDTMFLTALQSGCAVAIAHVRGGGEFGVEWHRAGQGVRKEKTIQDLEGVVRRLSEDPQIQGDGIGLYGASLGGLVVATAWLRFPELLRYAIASHGVYNLARLKEFVNGALNIPEYGDPDNPLEWEQMQRYSPVHLPVDQTDYPPLLLITDESDERVSSDYTDEFIDYLSRNGVSDQVFELRYQNTGHGNLASTDDRWDDVLNCIAFARTVLKEEGKGA